jgi:hypothetical protein
LALVVTLTLVVDVPACKAVLMLHVFLARLCGVLPGRHPGPGTPGVVGAGSGASRVQDTPSSAFNPVLGPWGKPIRSSAAMTAQAGDSSTASTSRWCAVSMLLR